MSENPDDFLDGAARLRMNMQLHPEWFQPDPKPQRRDIEGTISGLVECVGFLMKRATAANDVGPVVIADHVRPLQERIDGLEAELMEMRREIARQAAVHVEDSER